MARLQFYGWMALIWLLCQFMRVESFDASLTFVLETNLYGGDSFVVSSPSNVLVDNKDAFAYIACNCYADTAFVKSGTFTITLIGLDCKLEAKESITVIISGLDPAVGEGNTAWVVAYGAYTVTFDGVSSDPTTTSNKVILSFTLGSDLTKEQSFVLTTSPNVIMAKQASLIVDIDSKNRALCSFKASSSPMSVATITLKGTNCVLSSGELIKISISSGLDFITLGSSKVEWTVKYSTFVVTITDGPLVADGPNKVWQFLKAVTSSTGNNGGGGSSTTPDYLATIDKPLRPSSQQIGASLAFLSVRFISAYTWTEGGTVKLVVSPPTIVKANESPVTVDCRVNSIPVVCTASTDDTGAVTILFDKSSGVEAGNAIIITMLSGLQQNPSSQERVDVVVWQMDKVTTRLSYTATTSTSDATSQTLSQYFTGDTSTTSENPVRPSTIIGGQNLSSLAVRFTSPTNMSANSTVTFTSDPSTVFNNFKGYANVSRQSTETYTVDAQSGSAGSVTINVGELNAEEDVSVVVISEDSSFGYLPDDGESVNIGVKDSDNNPIAEVGFITYSECDTLSYKYYDFELMDPGYENQCSPYEAMYGLETYNCTIVEDCSGSSIIVCTEPMPQYVVDSIKHKCIRGESPSPN